MKKEDIEAILKDHMQYLRGEGDHLRAYLRRADLSDADLRGADLRMADLRRADLSDADLRGADLREANLCDADLSDANLRDANLRDANLYDADLRRATLSGADLRGTNLIGADLRGALLPFFSVCPPSGSFIAWKKLLDGNIAKLEIPSFARRTSSLVGRKCRAEIAMVLSIHNAEGVEIYSGESWGGDRGSKDVIYKTGDFVSPDFYDPDIRLECTHGIHFFITKAEAVDW